MSEEKTSREDFHADRIATGPDLQCLRGDREFEAMVAEVNRRIGEE